MPAVLPTPELLTQPTERELRALPRLAQVAYAVRAARRVQPLYVKYWPDAPQRHVDAIEQAITSAERFADGRTLTAAEAAEAAAGDADAEPDAEPEAAYVAVAAYYAAAATAHRAAYHAARAARAADAEVAFLSSIRSDFELLRQFSALGKWTDETPVPVTILGPLWPDGPPDWYVEATQPAPPPEPDPAVLKRAERILGGDVHPEDYLPVPEAVRTAVVEHLRTIEADHGFTTAPEAVRQLLNEWTLLHHHDGNTVLAKYADHGVLVLAAGGQQIYQIKQHFNPDSRSGFALMSPSTAW